MASPEPVYYAAFLDLRDRRCLVVGGGVVAARKVRSLVQAGGLVTVVAPSVDPRITADPAVHVEERAYRDTDLHGVNLVICATDDGVLNRTIAQDAHDLGILVNVVDCPGLCNFILPAIGARGPVQVAVSSGGKSPSLARKLRDRVLETIGPEYGELARLLGELRQEVQERIDDADARAGLLDRMSDEHFMELVRQGCLDQAHAEMKEMLERAAREQAGKQGSSAGQEAGDPSPDGS